MSSRADAYVRGLLSAARQSVVGPLKLRTEDNASAHPDPVCEVLPLASPATERLARMQTPLLTLLTTMLKKKTGPR